MCEALFNLNRTFLSLPAGAVTAVAFSASMNDQYGKDPELGVAKRESRETTPPPGAFSAPPGAPRAVGKRTPRGHPQKKKDVHSPDFDVLEMAGQALVSMSPAPAAARAKSSKSSWHGGSGDDARAPEAAFGSPAPSPARAKSSKRSDDVVAEKNLKSSRALFPASSDDDAAITAGTATDGVAATAREPLPSANGLDDEAFGALDGLFMLADASTAAAKPPAGGRGKKGKPGGKPPRAPAPKSPARKKVDGGAAATPPRARFSAHSAKDALEIGLGPPIRGRGRAPGKSRKSALKATQPVRLRDGVAGGGFYRSPARVPAYAYAANNGRYADPDTPGTAQLTKGLGLLGPRHVEEAQLETRLGGVGGVGGVAAADARDPPGTPSRGGVSAGAVPGTPSTPANRVVSSTSLFASTPGVLRGAPSAARRRWFLAEHFYGSIDKPWFRAVGYAPFLRHLGLDAVGRAFTKKEWLSIRRAMGAPRRLSLPFLRRERVALEKWRGATREGWAKRLVEASDAPRRVKTEAGTGAAGASGLDDAAPRPVSEPVDAEIETRDGAPVTVDDWNPKPFEVGDRVAARHPRVLNVNTGSILIARGTRHLVQFDRIELGVELVRDINIAHLPHHLDALLLEEEEKEREAAAAAAAKEAAEEAAADAAAADAAAAVADADPLRRVAPAGGGPIAPAAALAAAAAKLGKRVAGLSGAEAAKAATAAAIAAAAEAAAAAAARGDADAALLLGDAAGRAPDTAEAVAAAFAAAAASSSREGSAGGGFDAEASAASAREEDARALAEVTNALDLKERLVSELRAMNDVAETNAEAADAKKEAAAVASPCETVLEPFQRQYASTMLKVRECNAHLQNALAKLRAQHRRRELAGASGAWRRFAPGGGAAARGDGGAIFAPLDDDAPSEDAYVDPIDSGSRGGGVDATPSLTRSNATAEIVAACEYVAARRVREGRKAARSAPSSEAAFAPACRAVGAMLAVKTCVEHGADETLFGEVVERCLASMAPRSENAEAFEELKAGFDALRVAVYGGR